MAGKRKSVEGNPEPKKSAKKSARKSAKKSNEKESILIDYEPVRGTAQSQALSPLLDKKITSDVPQSFTPSRVLFNTGDWYKSSAVAPSPKPSSSRSSASQQKQQQQPAASSKKGGKATEERKPKGPSLHFKELEWIDYTFLAIVALTLLSTFYFLATSVAFALKPAPPPPSKPSTSSYFASSATAAASAPSTSAQAASSYTTWLFESVGLLSTDAKGSAAPKDFWANPSTTKDSSSSWATDMANSLYNSAFGTAAAKK